MIKKSKKILFTVLLLAVGILLIVFAAGLAFRMKTEKPEEILRAYFSAVEEKDYESMYQMVDPDTLINLDKEGFIQRNSRIYEGMEAHNIRIENIQEISSRGKTTVLSYDISMDTAAGTIAFSDETGFVRTKNRYLLLWNDGMILPDLTPSDKVSVVTDKAQRGRILDRNGKTLAGPGIASSVGIVPGKLQNKEEAVKELALLLDMREETILQKLSASWVKEDSFVPLATIPKVSELELMAENPGQELLQEQQRQEQLLAVPGVMLTDQEIRTYPLGEAASHLIGYVQPVTAEDLEEHKGEGYDAASVIGKSGAELLYEKELKGKMDVRSEL